MSTGEKYNDGYSTGHMCIVQSPCRHKETWWWNDEVAEAVREKKKKVWKLEKGKIDRGMEGVQEE